VDPISSDTVGIQDLQDKLKEYESLKVQWIADKIKQEKELEAQRSLNTTLQSSFDSAPHRLLSSYSLN